MLEPNQLYDYQKQAVLHQLYNPQSMLWLDMGLGKTAVTLTTIEHLMRAGSLKKTLIFGPVRVIHSVWEREARKWSHTKHLRCMVLSGTPDQRRKALFMDADVYLCSYENMNWLAEILNENYVKRNYPMPFQFVVYDEVSKMKNPDTVRYKGGTREKKERHTGKTYEVDVTGWKKVADQFKYTSGLTGTPASNGYIDLFGQYLVVDGGKRLGKFITQYRDNYFQSDYMGWAYTPTVQGAQWIEYNISDITIKMDAKDYLDLPISKEVNMMIDLPARAREHYIELEKEMFTELDSGTDVDIFSKNSISNKCLQVCNGAAYYDASIDSNGNVVKSWDKIHDAKLDALEDILEEAGGQPVLVAYSFAFDAERIMKRFKSYHPVNMTDEKAKMTEPIINDWNAGKIKLLIGHPACLHPSTQVLTELRGWVRLIDVNKSDRVFDGVEFVKHNGCSYSGHKPVINVFGITMTPEHKILINNEWCEGKNVRDNQNTKRKALYQYKGDDIGISEMFKMQHSEHLNKTERSKTQPFEKNPLFKLCSRQLSQYDWFKDLANMGWHGTPCKKQYRQELRWTWYKGMYRMVRFCKVLFGHAERLCRPLDVRTYRCEQGVQQTKLQMGDYIQATRKQEKQPCYNISGKEHAPSRTVPSNRVQQNNVNNATEQGYECRRSSGRLKDIKLWKRNESKEKAHVYDLLDCGPRNRFVVRNEEGESFISHNSMGHGVDGLQQAGSIVVWFGLNWSLELYEQMNRRLDRNGQTKSVKIIRILCNDTVDLAVADSLANKNDTQRGLKEAIQRYRDGNINIEPETKTNEYDFM